MSCNDMLSNLRAAAIAAVLSLLMQQVEWDKLDSDDAPSPPEVPAAVAATTDDLKSIATAWETHTANNSPVVVDVWTGGFRCLHCDRMKSQAAEYLAAGLQLQFVERRVAWPQDRYPYCQWTTADGRPLSFVGYLSPEDLAAAIERNDPGRLSAAKEAAYQGVRIGALKGTRGPMTAHLDAMRDWLGSAGEVELRVLRGADAQTLITVPGTSVALDLPREIKVRYTLTADGAKVLFPHPPPAIRVGKLLPMRQEVRGIELRPSEITIDLPWMIDPSIGLEE